jgi:hypothetical protein
VSGRQIAPAEFRLFRAYGMLFGSTIPLPELRAVDPTEVGGQKHPDVVIVVSDFPDQLPDALASTAVRESNADACLLRVAGVARYLIRRGREILIDPDPGAGDHDLRVYLLGTCLGVLLHQRGFLVLHASGVAVKGGAVLFAGRSGAGKSTLLGEMLRRGHRMMVDDVCAITFDTDGRPTVVPSYPRTRLWADAAALFSIDTSDLPRTRPTWDKFERQVWDQFWDLQEPLTHVFHLAAPHDDGEIALERLGSMDAFQTLVDQTYRGILLDGLDRRSQHFDLASRVAKDVQVIRARRPADRSRLGELAELIIGSLDGG